MAIGGINSDFRHGTNGALTTLTDFTTKTRSLNPSYDSETVDSTCFGTSSKSYEQSFKNATIEATYKYDDTLYGQLAAIYNAQATVSFQIAPNGATTGKPKQTGSMFITKFGNDMQVGNLEELTVSWQVTGAVTFGTV